jgi:signal peptidase I
MICLSSCAYSVFLRPFWLASVVILCGCGRSEVTQESSSMSPTIQPGQIVALDRRAYRKALICRWDVIAFRPPRLPDQLWISRVVGLPGEDVSLTNGNLLVNGRQLAFPLSLANFHYTEGTGATVKPIHYPIRLGSNSYLVLGDNSSRANDSRYVGPIERQMIVGRIDVAK